MHALLQTIRSIPLTVALIFALLGPELQSSAAQIKWKQISSKNGELPVPGTSTQQTGLLVTDLDGDGVDDFVVSFRETAPALVWYRRTAAGWIRRVIEKDFLTVEAGGAVLDIDGDGYPDIVFGGDWQSNEVWWWENPGLNSDPNTPWKRHTIKKSGAKQHHDQVFGDFLGKGKPQLAFWNQGAKKLFLAEIPKNPREAAEWPLIEVFSGSAGERGDASGGFKYAEGASAADIDGDGKVDLLAGNFWFKHLGGTKFLPVKVGTIGGRIRAGALKPGKYLQIVIAPGDGNGPLTWYECTGIPTNSVDWIGHDLAGRDLIHGHTLDIGDIDGDGHLDIFAAEMAKWTEKRNDPDNPKAEAFIFYGDGKGHFKKTTLAVGNGFHEGRLADIDGDGDLDIVNKPYNWEAPRIDVWLNNGTGPHKTPGIGKSFKGPIGLQLYSMRHHFPTNVLATFDKVQRFGFHELEGGGTYKMPLKDYLGMLDAHGLKIVSVGSDFKRLSDEPEKAIAAAKEMGAQFIMCSWIPHPRGKFSEKECREAIRVFNAAGKKIRAAGLTLTYHPHGYEFQPFDARGTLFDLMVRETDPKAVKFEMDVFWAVHGGADPVQLLKKYGKRFELMHVKDLRKGVKTGDPTGGAPDSTSVAIGDGQVDWPTLLREAKRIGIKHYFIEDEAVEAIYQIPDSLRYLERVRF